MVFKRVGIFAKSSCSMTFKLVGSLLVLLAIGGLYPLYFYMHSNTNHPPKWFMKAQCKFSKIVTNDFCVDVPNLVSGDGLRCLADYVLDDTTNCQLIYNQNRKNIPFGSVPL